MNVSKKLNFRYGWPVNVDAPKKLWHHVLKLRYPKDIKDAKVLTKENFERLRTSFRINIRVLANVRFIAVMICSLAALVFYLLSRQFGELFNKVNALPLVIFFLGINLFADGSNAWLFGFNSW